MSFGSPLSFGWPTQPNGMSPNWVNSWANSSLSGSGCTFGLGAWVDGVELSSLGGCSRQSLKGRSLKAGGGVAVMSLLCCTGLASELPGVGYCYEGEHTWPEFASTLCKILLRGGHKMGCSRFDYLIPTKYSVRAKGISTSHLVISGIKMTYGKIL